MVKDVKSCTVTELGSCQLPRDYSENEHSHQIESDYNGTVFVADGTQGLQIIKVKSPSNPIIEGHWGPKCWHNSGISGAGVSKYLFSSFATKGLQILENIPSNPYLVGFYNNSLYVAERIKAIPPLIYTTGDMDFTIFNVSNPQRPKIESQTTYYINGINSNEPFFDVYDKHAFVASNNFLVTFLMFDEKNVQRVSVFQQTVGSIQGVKTLGSNTVLITVNGNGETDKGGLWSIDTSDPQHPKLRNVYKLSYAKKIAISANRAFVNAALNSSSRIMGLFIIDISNPSNLKLAGSYQLPNNLSIWDVGVGNTGEIYVTDEKNKFYVLKVNC